MSTPIITLLDPEYLIPSADNLGSVEFWSRLFEIEANCDAKVESQLYADFCDLTETLQEQYLANDFPMQDFWTMMVSLSSQLFEVDMNDSLGCAISEVVEYSPLMGDPSNVDHIRRLIHSTQGDEYIALLSDAAFWKTEKDVLRCEHGCSESTSVYLTNLNEFSSNSPESFIWRRIILENPEMLFDYYTEAFPDLMFSKNIFNNISEIPGDKREIESMILGHLEVLNDHVVRIWEESVDTKAREIALNGHAVVASRESPRTHKDKDAMRERKIKISDVEYVCEWHTKLFATAGRIYFYVDSGNARVVVGKIVRHLK